MVIDLHCNCKEAEVLARSIGIDVNFVEIESNFSLKKKESPCFFIERVVKEQAEKFPNALVCIKTVFVGRRLILQPQTEAEAERIVRLYSGRNHTILTGIARKVGERISFRKTSTRVKVKHITEVEIQRFLQSEEWKNVGGYDLNGLFMRFCHKIVGSHTGMLGFPCLEAGNLLQI